MDIEWLGWCCNNILVCNNKKTKKFFLLNLNLYKQHVLYSYFVHPIRSPLNKLERFSISNVSLMLFVFPRKRDDNEKTHYPDLFGKSQENKGNRIVLATNCKVNKCNILDPDSHIESLKGIIRLSKSGALDHEETSYVSGHPRINESSILFLPTSPRKDQKSCSIDFIIRLVINSFLIPLALQTDNRDFPGIFFITRSEQHKMKITWKENN